MLCYKSHRLNLYARGDDIIEEVLTIVNDPNADVFYDDPDREKFSEGFKNWEKIVSVIGKAAKWGTAVKDWSSNEFKNVIVTHPTEFIDHIMDNKFIK